MDRYIPNHDQTNFRRRTRSPEPLARRPPATEQILSRRPDRRNITLPKNFDKPLTCFFWHQYGRCNKRDVDCAYAHWHTGFLASGPINLPGTSDSIAGKNAQNLTSSSLRDGSDIAMQLAKFKEQEEMLRLRELDVRRKEKSVAKREEDLAKSVRLREKELSLREKRVARREEALRSATQ